MSQIDMTKPNIIIKENFVKNPDDLLSYCLNHIQWDDRLKARKTASFGVSYDYSGITYPQCDIPPKLNEISALINKELNYLPNNCLLNYYPNGDSTMGFHSDSSEELKVGTGVSIVSLGAIRTITFRNKANRSINIDYELKNGALLFMDKLVQDEWLHAIPKTINTGIRISLTFRNIIKKPLN
jgi:alkylated DNA repair dioxygenase AlkB